MKEKSGQVYALGMLKRCVKVGVSVIVALGLCHFTCDSFMQIALGFIIEKKEGSLNVDPDLFKSLLVSIVMSYIQSLILKPNFHVKNEVSKCTFPLKSCGGCIW
jgi:hypothetical protein